MISLVEKMYSWGMQELGEMCNRYEALAKEMKKNNNTDFNLMKINSSADNVIYTGDVANTLTTDLTHNCKHNSTGRKCRVSSGYSYIRERESSYGIAKKVDNTKRYRHDLDVDVYTRQKKRPNDRK